MPAKQPARSSRTRVFLVDDHPIVRQGFRLLINMEPDMTVCGEAGGSAAALQKILQLKPDVAIVDLSLESGSGLELIKQLHFQCPALKMLVFTMSDGVIYAERALRAGAHGYITKEEGTDKAIDALRQLMRGKSYVSEKMAAKMVETFAGGRSLKRASVDLLSDRELEVFEHIGRGMASREIAQRLHISMKTVESHREHIKDKLGLTRAAELVSYAHHWVASRGGLPADPEDLQPPPAP